MMKGMNEAVYLEDLRSFRWELYHHRSSVEKIRCLTRYYYRQYYFQHFAEEIIIAGYDLGNLNEDIQQEVLLQIPHLCYKNCPSLIEKDDAMWDLNRLFMCLLYGNQLYFIKGVELIAEKRPDDLCKTIICTGFILWQLEDWINPSVRATFLAAIDTLKSLHNVEQSLIDSIFYYQSQYWSWKGKKYSNVIEVMDTLFVDVKFRHRNMIENFSCAECIEIMIDWDQNINAQLLNGETALYHAVQRNNLKAIFKLLQKGSFIGSATNLFDSIWNSDPKVLETHFDNCITRCVNDERFIEIDFKNLLSPANERDSCDGSSTDEMKAIELMADSCDHKHLLVHPVISTFVLLKWNQLAFLFHIHFILYIIFILSTSGYIFCVVNNIQTWIKMALFGLTTTLTAYMAMRRISHQIFESFCRILSVRNRMFNYVHSIHSALVVLFVILILLDLSEAYRSIIATICIMLMASELFVLAGSLLWNFSKYYVMFLDVTKSSIKSLQLCIIIVPAFIMSFYLLLWQESGVNNELNEERREPVNETDDSFTFLRAAFIKIVAMSAGEFEAASSNFESNIVSGYLFVVYLFLITMVFMNLMNGLAVNDTQKIQADAETTSMIQRVRLLAHFQGIILKNPNRIYHSSFLAKMIRNTKPNPLTLRNPSNTKIHIGPFNKVLILQKDYKIAVQRSTVFEQNGTYLNSWISYFGFSQRRLRVDRKIVHHARKILEAKHLKQREQYDKDQSRNRLLKLENDLNKLMQMTKQNQENIYTILSKLNYER